MEEGEDVSGRGEGCVAAGVEGRLQFLLLLPLQVPERALEKGMAVQKKKGLLVVGL